MHGCHWRLAGRAERNPSAACPCGSRCSPLHPSHGQSPGPRLRSPPACGSPLSAGRQEARHRPSAGRVLWSPRQARQEDAADPCREGVRLCTQAAGHSRLHRLGLLSPRALARLPVAGWAFVSGLERAFIRPGYLWPAEFKQATQIMEFVDKWHVVTHFKREAKRSILNNPFGDKGLVDAVTEWFMDLGKRDSRRLPFPKKC